VKKFKSCVIFVVLFKVVKNLKLTKNSCDERKINGNVYTKKRACFTKFNYFCKEGLKINKTKPKIIIILENKV
jgi:hypothetical protein